MWLLGILQHAAAATDIGASADQQTIDNQITAKNHRYPNTGVPQYLYRPRQVDGVVLQLLAAWLSVTHQSSRPSIRSTVRPVLRDANAALTAVWISLTRTETNTKKTWKEYKTKWNGRNEHVTVAVGLQRASYANSNTLLSTGGVAVVKHAWLHIGWQWRNFVPYLCQLVFVAILWAKLS